MIKEEEKLNRDLCCAGSRVYYWEENHGWAIGEVEGDDGKLFTVKGAEFSATKVAGLATSKVGDDKVWPVREDVLDEDVDDLLDLTVLHDATIQRCLYVRYMRDVVYTNIGAIVVALNPWNFKIPWYTDNNMPQYLQEGEVVKNCVPHSWSQAHNTWHDMRRDKENQTILISGESGAGKTEAAKIVMKYLGCLSCMHGEDKDKEQAKSIAFSINQASPVLEGFGNAKTVRNNNSSRFGKFMKVQFNTAGNLVGAFTIKYLLEKSRIVTATPGERVYHAFYLLGQGADAGRYGAEDLQSTHANAGGCIDIAGVDDAEDYTLCVEAMKNCGFTDDNIDEVWRVVGGIFNMLRVSFSAIDDDSCEVTSEGLDKLGKATQQWGTALDVLSHELVTSTMETRDGPITSKLNEVKAADGRDALCKALYDAVFGWEVNKINEKTDCGAGENFIGLLDIFGFEDFEYNSFEQICINLANETLQNHYNSYIFTKDMDECRSEGIDVTEVKCPDNGPCLRLMVDKTGIFGLLDDVCSMGKGTDSSFLDSVLQQCSSNPFFATKKLAKNSFIVNHYAASVNYTVEGWLDKNRDTLKPAMKNLMRASEKPLIASLLPEPDENARKVTVGGFFREQLVMLMNLINSTSPHWIRCVKPHPAKKPLMVHGITMMSQLESSGVLGTVKIRKAGFPVRPTFVKFISRFKVIVQPPYPSMDSPAATMAEFSKKILAAAGLEKQKAQAGKTRVFLKNEANHHLEALREQALKDHIVCLKRHSWTTISEKVTRKKMWAAAARVVQSELREWIAKTSDTRAEAKRVRQEQARIFAAEQSKIFEQEEMERNQLDSECMTDFLEMRADLFEDSRILRIKGDQDDAQRGDLLLEATEEKGMIYVQELHALDQWKVDLLVALQSAVVESEEYDRKHVVLPQRNQDFDRIKQLFEYETGFVQLKVAVNTERDIRRLLMQLEAMQRQELLERIDYLQLFMDSLEGHVTPWLESLGAVRFWSDHIVKRKKRIADTRTHLEEIRLYEEQQSATVHNFHHRDACQKKSSTDNVWKGCTGVPDIEQMKSASDRAPILRPTKVAMKAPLDGSSSSPVRDASPMQRTNAAGVMVSPPRTGGEDKLIAKSPILPDYKGTHQSRREAAGLSAKLGNIGTYTPAQFLTMREKVVDMFAKLKDEGHYPYDGKYTYSSAITDLRSLRCAQDELHDVRAELCATLGKQLTSKVSFAKRNSVLQQCPVTGSWAPVVSPEWNAAVFQGDPALWEDLSKDCDRITVAIKNHKIEMVNILHAVAAEGHTVLSDVTHDSSFLDVQSVYEYWAKSHVPKSVSAAERFTTASRRFGGGPTPIRIPPSHPSTCVKHPSKTPRTPRAHIDSTSPLRSRN